jgi:tryptophan 2,3-dioxygenase
VYDHLLRYLARSPAQRGAGLAIPRATLERDTSQPHEANEAVVQALLPLYKDPASNYPAFRLCEHFLEFDERFRLWRFHHVNMVERMIGFQSGTGGSTGAKYLMSTVERRFFPELWMVRTHIGGVYGEAGRS